MNHFMKLTIHFCFLALAASIHGQGVLIFVPNASLAVEGNSASSTPFNQTGVRFQQVYAASEFSLVPGWIRTIGFRVDVSPQGGQAFSATLPNVQVNLSTTLRQPDTLSPVFAENLGLDERVVRSGSLSLMSQAAHLPGQPNLADAVFSLSNPFLYDPARGNLLLDVRNFMGAATSPFDAINTSGDSVSSLFSIGANSTSGTLSTLGLFTRFVVDPVPEPSTWALFITGVAAFALFHRTRRKSK